MKLKASCFYPAGTECRNYGAFLVAVCPVGTSGLRSWLSVWQTEPQPSEMAGQGLFPGQQNGDNSAFHSLCLSGPKYVQHVPRALHRLNPVSSFH